MPEATTDDMFHTPTRTTTRRPAVARICAIIGILLSGTVVSTLAPSPVHAALQVVARYEMNEGPTATVLVDSSPSGLDGSIGDDIVTNAKFDGATGYRWPFAEPDSGPVRPQRLAIVEHDSLLNPGSSEFAVEVRYRTTEDFGNIVQKGQSATPGGYWKVEQPDGYATCLFRNTLADQASLSSPTRLNDGDWHTVRCIRSATRARMYVDGELVDSRNVSVGSISNDRDLTIGGKADCNQNTVGCDYFTGSIDYVQIDKDRPDAPNDPPDASFSTTCNGLVCTFDSSASSDADGTIVGRTWAFGDGSTLDTTDDVVTHEFAEPDHYTVTFTATDDLGASSSTAEALEVVHGASKFVPIDPTRLFDTRPGELPTGYKGVVEGGTSLVVQVTGRAGIPPTGVTAVALNVTGVGIEAPGHISVTPETVASPTTSSLNILTPGQVRANLVIVPVGTNGTISIFALRDAHVIGDVAGYFVDQPDPSDDGRIISVAPQRLFDTRTTSVLGPAKRIPAGGTIEATVLGKAGVPAKHVSAVVLNVTGTQPDRAGFVTVWPGGAKRPATSSLNVNRAGETSANQVIVPVGGDGTIQLFSTSEIDLVVDVFGYVTDDGATSEVSGLFVPLTPGRVVDTRTSEPGPKGIIAAGSTIHPTLAGSAGIPSKVGAVVLNVTVIGTAPGHATLWPTGEAKPTTSNVNVDGAGDVRANGAIVGLGTGGRLDIFVISTAHAVADAVGYLVK